MTGTPTAGLSFLISTDPPIMSSPKTWTDSAHMSRSSLFPLDAGVRKNGPHERWSSGKHGNPPGPRLHRLPEIPFQVVAGKYRIRNRNPDFVIIHYFVSKNLSRPRAKLFALVAKYSPPYFIKCQGHSDPLNEKCILRHFRSHY